MQNLTSHEQYQLRKAQMDVEKKALETERAKQELQRLTLELEYKYNVLSDHLNLELGTIAIPSPMTNGSSIENTASTVVREHKNNIIANKA